MLKRSLFFIFSIVFCCLFSFNSVAQATSLSGEKVFEMNCAGCHVNGGNIIRRGKNLKIKALHKYGYDSVEAIAEIVTYGKNNMSAYEDKLSSEEIQNVAQYVIQKAENNWK